MTLTNTGLDFRGWVQVRDAPAFGSRPEIIHRYQVDLPSNSRKQITLNVPFYGEFQAAALLVDEQGVPKVRQQKPIQSIDSRTGFLIGVVASDRSLLNGLSDLTGESGQPIAVAHLTLDELPDLPQLWHSLDLLVINDLDTRSLTAGQRAAMQGWVEQGGQLVIGGGPNGTQTMAGLTGLLPLGDLTIDTLPHPLPALAALHHEPLPDRGPYVAALPTRFSGAVQFSHEGKPLIITDRVGQGQIVYSVFDLSLAPLDTLVEQIVFVSAGLGVDVAPKRGDQTATLDVSQLQTVLSLLANRALPDPMFICLYLLVYVLLVGPVNYGLLRLFRKGEWGWVTLPLLIFGCSGLLYVTGFSLRGSSAQLAELQVVQANQHSDIAALTTVAGIYSPSRSSYVINLPNEQLIAGLPDSIGIDTELTVDLAGQTTLTGLRSDIGGLPAFMSHTTIAPPQLSASLTVDNDRNLVTGTLDNQTGQPLSDAAIVLIRPRPMFNEEQLLMANLGELETGQRTIEERLLARQPGNTFYPAATSSESVQFVSRDLTLRTVFDEALDQYRYNEAIPTTSAFYLIGWQSSDTAQVQVSNFAGSQTSERLVVLNLDVVE